MKKGIFLIVLIVSIQSQGQFFDFNFFKPRVSFQGEFLHQTQNSSLSYWNSGVNALIPIKGKLNLDVDWKNMLQSKSLKEAFGKVTPKAYQLFGELGYQTQNYLNPSYFGPFQTYKAGLTGIWVKYKKKKIRTFLLSGNIRFTNKSAGNNSALNPSLFAGTSIVHGLKNFVVIGGYASYYGNRFIASPVLVWYHRFSSKWSSTLVAPIQVKLTWKHNRKFKQELVVSYFGFNHATSYTSILNEPLYSGVNAVSGLRLSTQSRIKMGKLIDFYLELGWQYFSRTGLVQGYQLYNKEKYDGSLFAKARVTIAFGKALVNPKVFDFGL